MTAQVFATALGGGMSSRLFQEAREKRGLCYAIYAFSQSHRDAGVIGIYAGTGEDKAGEVTPLIAAEIEAMAKGATEEEAARARAQLKASLLMALESPGSRCEQIAGHLFNFGRVLSTKEMTARVDAVDAAALRRFATKLCERADPRDGVGRTGQPSGVARPLCAPLRTRNGARERLIHVHAGDDLSGRP